MDIGLVVSLVLVFSILYFLIHDKNNKIKKQKEDYKDRVDHNNKEKNGYIVVFIDDAPHYLALDEYTRIYYLTEDKNVGEIFKLEYIARPGQEGVNKQDLTYYKNKVSIRSKDNYYLNLRYTTFNKAEYDISSDTKTINNTCILKINKSKDKFYIKFFNEHYMCLDRSKCIFSSNKKNKIMFFAFEQIDNIHEY